MAALSIEPAATSDLKEMSGPDPLGYRVDLPFRATFHPMGYPVEICSNAAEVLDVAAKLWDRYPVLSDAEPVRLRVIAGSERLDSLPEPSPPRGQGHLLSIVHGPHDFAVADLSAGFAFANLSHKTLSTPAYFRYHFLEPLAYVMQAARHFVFVHASCISQGGRAIVLCGDSGAGKTCLAYACARRGWEFVSGDAVHVVRGGREHTVIGRPYEIRFRESAVHLFPELRSAPAELRVNGKVDLEMDTARLDIPVALKSVAQHIVFLERADRGYFETMPHEHALRRLQDTICFGADQTRREQLETLANFARLPVWRLHYPDLDQAERLLGSLLDTYSRC